MKTFLLAMFIAFAVVFGLEFGKYLAEKSWIKKQTDKYPANKFVKSQCDELETTALKHKASFYISLIAEVIIVILYILS